MINIKKNRNEAVTNTIDCIKKITNEKVPNRESLEEIKSALVDLASKTELFPEEDFQPPEKDAKRNSCLYRISEDDNNQNALYINSALGTYDTPAHNHTTWAVIVGIQGVELNKLYTRLESGGVDQKDEYVVENGKGIAFLPDDLHSIHINTEEKPLLNFHMYGLSLERLVERKYYVPNENTWKNFPPHSDIREAR